MKEMEEIIELMTKFIKSQSGVNNTFSDRFTEQREVNEKLVEAIVGLTNRVKALEDGYE